MTERNEPKDGILTQAPRGGSASSLGKMAFIGVLIGLLMIPMGMIQSLITEREGTRASAEREVEDKWGGNQQLAGPILTVPYRVFDSREITEYVKGEKYTKVKTDTTIEYAHFLPERLTVEGAVDPEIRHRGIFDVALYKADLHLHGRFAQPDFQALRIDPANVVWQDAYVSISIPDPRSLSGQVPWTWNGQVSEFAPNLAAGSPIREGGVLHVPVALGPRAPGKDGYPFEMRVGLNGSGTLNFLPMGKETHVAIESPWTGPSFKGAFLPRENKVGEKGFRAAWSTVNLSRSFPQAWLGANVAEKDWEPYAFGVEFRLPVDRYQKTTRCAKYAVLFIVLTFLVFFMNETFDKKRIHPLQYLLVGCALCLFYLLLLAFTEHVPFAAAYAIASAGVVGLITAYGAAVLSARKRAYALGGMLAGLYAYLYTLLQMEDQSLLMGAIGLFAILAVVMYLTRRLNLVAPAALAEAA